MMTKYCYWSVCDGAYDTMMEHCVRTARGVGVFKEFHVLADRRLAGCECYDAYQCDKASGLFKLHYLKLGMSELNYDWFVWLDADTVFVRNPVDVLEPLGQSPIHLPLTTNLSALTEDREYRGFSCFKLRDLLRQEGIVNQPYLSRSAFWIVHHDVIDEVYEIALSFWRRANDAGLSVGADAAIGYVMQILCADPEAHTVLKHPHLWGSDDQGQFRCSLPDARSWTWRDLLVNEAAPVWPAIVHLPHSKDLLSLAHHGRPDRGHTETTPAERTAADHEDAHSQHWSKS